MSRPGVLCVVPARIGSTRLFEKPLTPLLGTPLIVWSWRNLRRLSFIDRLVVAADDARILEAARAEGAEALRTSFRHASGTDRTREAADLLQSGQGRILNVQGDEPFLPAAAIRGSLAMLDKGFDIGTAAAPITDLCDFNGDATVKVARAKDGRALYFSRSPIPGGAGEGPALGLRHLGVYAFEREALERWTSLDPSPLERREKLEQLRALENGMKIGVSVVDDAPPGVDVAQDVGRAERVLLSRRADGASLTRPQTQGT